MKKNIHDYLNKPLFVSQSLQTKNGFYVFHLKKMKRIILNIMWKRYKIWILAFINKVLLETSQDHVFTYCLLLLFVPQYWSWVPCRALKVRIFTVWAFTKNVFWPLLCSNKINKQEGGLLQCNVEWKKLDLRVCTI